MACSTVNEEPTAARRADVIRQYPARWSKMIGDWRRPGRADRAWLMYSASYLLRVNGIHWAIDPLRLQHRAPEAPGLDFARDLDALVFVLLTHSHADHLDLELIRTLRHLPILWIIPPVLLVRIRAATGLPLERIIVPEPSRPIDLRGIRITPFEGLHWETPSSSEADCARGVPATGYLIESGCRRWLFPGDVRTFDVRQMPDFGHLDGLFAHLWLGRGCALLEHPPLLDEFCRFFVDLMSDRIILTHLDEYGRDGRDLWEARHVQMVSAWFQRNAPQIQLEAAFLGEAITL